MKRIRAIALALSLLLLAAPAWADLDLFLRNLNVEAQANLGDFTVKLGAQFGMPVPRVEAVLRAVDNPAEAFMCFQLGEMAGKPPEAVLETYKRDKGKGWGVIAKDLGIKPGSAEFHALKNGDLSFTGTPGHGHGGGGGKGKGKGHKKDSQAAAGPGRAVGQVTSH